MKHSRPAPDPVEARPPFYQVEPWAIREIGFDPAGAARSESVFALGNGHLGWRGNLEEDAGNVARGTYINGFHETSPIVYPEGAHAFAREHQVMLNIADGKRIRLEVGGEPLDLATGTVEHHERELDLRTGILTRRLRWRSPAGVLVEVATRRLVSLTRRSVGAIDYEVVALETPTDGIEVRLVSALDAGVENLAASDDPRVGSHVPPGSLRVERCEAQGSGGTLVQRARTTRLAVAIGVGHRAWSSRAGAAGEPGSRLEEAAVSSVASEAGITSTVAARLGTGERLRLVKALGYATSIDEPEGGIAESARALADAATADGFEALASEQAAAVEGFWSRSDVELDGDAALQQGVRFNLFSIFQSAGRGGRSGLAAKGLTGEGYEGHYFWDTEVFAVPFLVYTQPAIARDLLRFRISTLPQAREHAAELSERGALYAWRTINGREASAYFPAGSAQYHIDADIALALVRYLRVTGDRELLLAGGAELLFETARMWVGLGARIAAHGGAFCINEVTGPDEYSALVNNNAFTNLMARANLRHAARVADDLGRDEPEAWARIRSAIRLADDEPAAWLDAAAAMRIPRDAELGIHLQDDAFLDREPWDLPGTPADSFPLLLHYHPLVIYRHAVLKQADVVLAQVLLAHEFTRAQKRRNFLFYDPLTTGDSSLSPSIQAVAAAELGFSRLAYDYFVRTARMDLDDVNGNTGDGVHIAAMAGSWMGLVAGFAGFRDDDGELRFAPALPQGWRRLAFRLGVGESLLRVELTPGQAQYEVTAGPPLTLHHFADRVTVEPGHPVVIGLRPTLRAVVFDLDGVLTDTAELHYRAWQRMADEEGMAFDRTVNERLRGIGRLESLEIILEHAGRSGLDDAAKRALTDRKNGYFRELIAGITPADLLPGMDGLLDALRRAGIRIAIASASHNAAEVVERLGIGGRVDASVDPATVEKGKPDPEIFLAAAEQLRVRPADCVGVEDAVAGIEAIRAAGMVAVGVGAHLPDADWAVADTREITVERLAALVSDVGPREVPAGPVRQAG